jgi:adhesin transport system membrane fusion protein
MRADPTRSGVLARVFPGRVAEGSVRPDSPSGGDLDFTPQRLAASLEKPAAPARWTLWTVVLLVGASIFWAQHALIDVVTTGEGTVIPSSQVQTVQNLEGGIVAEIPVKLGQRVVQGDVLMRIDDTRFKATFQESRARDDAFRARIARLSAESSGTPFNAPAELRRASPTLVSQELELHGARRAELTSSVEVLGRQVEQRERELGERKARDVQLRQSHGLVLRELEMTRPLLRQGVVSEVEVLRLERQASDLKGELDATAMAIPRLEAAIAETRQRVQETQAKFRSDAARELSQVRAEQSAISAANSANEDRVSRTLVKSPVNGTVKTIKINTIGGVVQPGIDLFEIVPSEDGLFIEAHIRPSDIAFLQVGQDATVKISAYDFAIYGGFAGRVEHISADTLMPEKPGERPEPYYRVRVRTTGAKAGSGGEPLPMLPGMTATVDIKTGQRSVLTYLIKPIVRTRDTALRER